MDDQFQAGLRKVCQGHNAAALVTITQVKGSTPRKAGAKMLVTRDGQTFGTIGGGCGEAEVRREALNVLTYELAQKYVVNMTNDMAEDEGMVCGGIMEVFIDYLAPNAPHAIHLWQEYLESVARGESPVLVTLTESTSKEVAVGGKLLVVKDQVLGTLGSEQLNLAARSWMNQAGSKPLVVNLGFDLNSVVPGKEKPVYQLLIEPTPPLVELLVLGGGHIALPLVNIAKMLGYRVTVVDDRPQFANAARFGAADKVICEDFAKALQSVQINPQTSVVIVTRGHRHDKVCLRQVITQPAAYIGMIGSRRRVKALFAELREEGIDSARLQRVHSPIGLDISAETPEEIAVSIVGELVKTYRTGTPAPVS